MTGEPKNRSEHQREPDEYEPGSVAMTATLFASALPPLIQLEPLSSVLGSKVYQQSKSRRRERLTKRALQNLGAMPMRTNYHDPELGPIATLFINKSSYSLGFSKVIKSGPLSC